MAAKQFLIASVVVGGLSISLLPDGQHLIAEFLQQRPAEKIYTPEQAAPKLDRLTTQAIVPALSNNAAVFDSALKALSDDDYEQAQVLRDSLPKTSLDFKTLSWAMAYFAGTRLPSNDVARAKQLVPDWPGADILQANYEKALAKENLTPVQIILAFNGAQPVSFEGALMLARAYKTQSKIDAAIAVLKPFWLSSNLEAVDETAVIEEFGAQIPTAVHLSRMQKMLYETRVSSAARVAELAGAQALFTAWASVMRKDKRAGTLLDAVPQNQRYAGYIFAKARYLRRQDKTTVQQRLCCRRRAKQKA